MLVKKQMVEVDGGKAGREDQEDHAGWVASTDLLRGQVVLMLMLKLTLMLNTQREVSLPLKKKTKMGESFRLYPKSGWEAKHQSKTLTVILNG